MSYLWNDPARFTEESAAGFVLAHSDLVRAVPGGVARAGAPTPGRVAVVVGGGSGHYPAFAGLVGQGLADGAAMGNVFASPSAQQVYNVAAAVSAGAGVLLTYGNYAGDVLNFDQAQDRLRRDGIPCQSMPVTDDISSAAEAEKSRRRGIAGDLPVFKAAAWAADQGWDLDGVVAFSRHANERTRTVGVAFSGTTLPGASSPLFEVPAGQMAVGMGIHGEPGISEQPMATADDVARLLVEQLLGSLPDGIEAVGGERVAVIVNGLGSVKSEELFVVFRAVDQLLRDAGLQIVGPEVGEFATSFEMAGLSLTLIWLDEQLETAWLASCCTPAYRRGTVTAPEPSAAAAAADVAAPNENQVAEGSAGSRQAARLITACLDAVRAVVDENVEELGRLDAIAGDGDHGIGMQRGVRAGTEAAHRAAEQGGGAGTVLVAAGDAWADRAGGTSGALWGAALRAVGETFGDDETPTGASVVQAMDAATAAVTGFGKAAVGDKTMVDALVPFCSALRERVEQQGQRLADAWAGASEQATEAARATATLLPRLGRARPHQERSLGSPDPGAVSLALALTTVGQVLSTEGEQS